MLNLVVLQGNFLIGLGLNYDNNAICFLIKKCTRARSFDFQNTVCVVVFSPKVNFDKFFVGSVALVFHSVPLQF